MCTKLFSFLFLLIGTEDFDFALSFCIYPWLLHGLLLVLVSNIFLVLTFSYTILEQVNDVIGLQELYTMMPRFLADCCFSLVWGKPLLI